MRIGVLTYFAPRKLGSLEDWLLGLCEEAGQRGHQVDLWGREPLHPELKERLARRGVGWASFSELERQPLRAVRRLAQYDVLFLSMAEVREKLALLAYAAWPAKVVWVDHASGWFDPAAPALTEPPGLTARLSRLLDPLSVPRLSAVVGVSEYVRARNERRFRPAGVPVVTILNGVDVRRFRPSPPPGGEGLQLLAVANLIPQKGLHHLLGALGRLQDRSISLKVVGDGVERASLEGLARARGVEGQVEFLGLRDDVEGLLARSDVFVHPAIWPEAFGLTIAEAMACGRPVLASRVGGIPELIQDGESGLLVPPGDEAALAAALRRLKEEPALRARLGAAARARAVSRFCLETCVRQYVDLFEACVRAPAGLLRPAVAQAGGEAP